MAYTRAMKIVLKAVSLIAIWGVVAYIVWFIDPESVKDWGGDGLYLPFLLPVIAAVWYTFYLGWKSVLVATVVSAIAILGLILGMAGLMNMLLGTVLVLMILFTLYLHKAR